MNVANRIQHLRKSKGISQEELAEKIGVSRQAVSKWESEQSLPDMEKIILLSNYFEVTTDYILKGIDVVSADASLDQDNPNAMIFTSVGTAFNFIGVIVAAMIWYEQQSATATAVGLILTVIGCMIFGIGMSVSDVATRAKAKRVFLTINVWLLIFVPMSLVYNILSGFKGTAPYPLPFGSFKRYAAFWIAYIVVGTGIDVMLYKVRKHIK